MKNQLTPQEAALYLGQECIWRHRTWAGNGHYEINNIDSAIISSLEIGSIVVKPLLRPLADITEEEADELGYLSKEQLLKGWKKRAMLMLDPKEYIAALRMGLDVFNWIEQGKALDKTKSI